MFLFCKSLPRDRDVPKACQWPWLTGFGVGFCNHCNMVAFLSWRLGGHIKRGTCFINASSFLKLSPQTIAISKGGGKIQFLYCSHNIQCFLYMKCRVDQVINLQFGGSEFKLSRILPGSLSALWRNSRKRRGKEGDAKEGWGPFTCVGEGISIALWQVKPISISLST